MSAAKNESGLSGVWSGEYWYGGGGGRTPFAANIVDKAGILTGTTIEDAPRWGELSATLAGARTGSDVNFTKVYDQARELRACPIAYSGIANAELDSVEGDWVLMERNPLRGGFRMRRVSPRAEAEVTREAKEPVMIRR